VAQAGRGMQVFDFRDFHAAPALGDELRLI
jgi:hypothetical protein